MHGQCALGFFKLTHKTPRWQSKHRERCSCLDGYQREERVSRRDVEFGCLARFGDSVARRGGCADAGRARVRIRVTPS